MLGHTQPHIATYLPLTPAATHRHSPTHCYVPPVAYRPLQNSGRNTVSQPPTSNPPSSPDSLPACPRPLHTGPHRHLMSPIARHTPASRPRTSSTFLLPLHPPYHLQPHTATHTGTSRRSHPLRRRSGRILVAHRPLIRYSGRTR